VAAERVSSVRRPYTRSTIRVDAWPRSFATPWCLAQQFRQRLGEGHSTVGSGGLASGNPDPTPGGVSADLDVLLPDKPLDFGATKAGVDRECDRLGVPVLSVRESWLDTSGPVRPLLVCIFGWVAEQERSDLIGRTKAGLERARAQGKRLGRPPASPILLHSARDLVAAGMPVEQAAKSKGLSRSSLRRFLQVEPVRGPVAQNPIPGALVIRAPGSRLRSRGVTGSRWSILGRWLAVDGGTACRRLDSAASGVPHERVRLPGQILNWSTSRGPRPGLHRHGGDPSRPSGIDLRPTPRGTKILGDVLEADLALVRGDEHPERA